MVVALDIETSTSQGGSFEYWRSDFKVDSLSCAWRDPATNEIVHWYSSDPQRIRAKLAALARSQGQLVAHNLSFEYGVLSKLYPHLKLNWVGDTMRLAQHYDAGGSEFEMEPILSADQMLALELGETTEEELGKSWKKAKGLSLEACALRFLSAEHHNHKGPAHDWLRDNHGIKKKHGQYLHLLPAGVLEEYNNADTTITLLLYETLSTLLGDFDWRRDWQLYFMRIQLMAGAYIRGIRIDRPTLFKFILHVESEIADIERQFREYHAADIAAVEDLLLLMDLDWAVDPDLKSDRARRNRWESLEQDSGTIFNIGSAHHLAYLYCWVLSQEPKFQTKTGQPSFKASHISSYGPGGALLRMRKKRMLVLNQAVATYIASAYDGRLHANIKVSGTRSNRVAGGRD